MKKMKTENLEELKLSEKKIINGGLEAETVGYGIASGLALMTFGLYGWAYCTYNYFKD